MRIAAFLVSYGRAVGATLYTSTVLEALAARGHDVTVYADVLDVEPHERNGVHVTTRHAYRYGSKPGDVLLTHADYGPLPYTIASAHRIPLVYIVHNVGEQTAHGLREWPSTLTVWNAAATASHFGAEGGLILRSPLRVADYAAPRAKADAVTLVNLIPPKGSDLFYALAERFPETPFLGVRGGYGEQDERPALAEIIGPVPHDSMRDVYARTRVLLVPSEAESWGRVALEAACSGIPVLAAPTPGLLEALPQATFLALDDLDAWSTALAAALAGPKTSRASVTRAKAVEKASQSDLHATLSALEALTPGG